MIPVRILENQLEIYNTTIDLVATHDLARGRNEYLAQFEPAVFEMGLGFLRSGLLLAD